MPTKTPDAPLFGYRRYLVMLTLVLAGESIFFLPFLVPRIFRPTMLEVFELNNYELGSAQTLYGLVAMVAYALGGPLADYFSPRKQITVALAATAMGGVMLWRIPSLATLHALYAYWGFTTIALFWSALMKATREWGGQFTQGTAFGFLDGGRGLLSAILGTGTVALYASLLPEDIASASLAVRAAAFQWVVATFTSVVLLSAALVWIVLPRHLVAQRDETDKVTLEGMQQIASMPTVWLQALIILCAYVAYRSTDYLSLYAKEVFYADEVAAANLTNISLWLRPIGAIGAGLLADRFTASRMTTLSFALVLLSSVLLSTQWLHASVYPLFLLTVLTSSLGVYALRGLYFAIMQEGQVPLIYTGSAVGFVSVLGYTPDVFMGPLAGYLLDSSPGAAGLRHVFFLVTGFAAVGLVASVVFASVARRGNRSAFD